AQLARAGRFTDDDAARAALCDLLSRREPHVRANVVVALAALGHERCSGRLDAGAWMQAPHQLPVRVAAARSLEGAAAGSPASNAEWSSARAQCLARELAEELLRVCRQANAHTREGAAPRTALRTYAYAGDERTLLTHRWVVLRFE